MTKIELKNLIKECYAEVLKEMDYPKPGLADPSEPEGVDNPMLSSDEKIEKNLEAWRTWGKLMQQLKDIHKEPSVIAKLDALRKASFDSPLDRHDYN